MAKSDLVQSLLRGMDLLKMAASAPEGMRLSELAEKSSLQKTTAYNLLRTLCARNFLVKDQHNRFQLGTAIFELAAASQTTELMNKAAAALKVIHKKFPLDVLTFSTLEGTAVRCKLRISPDQPNEVQYPVNRTFPPYISVTALALQAAAPHKAEAIERQYPFEDYGEGMWGALFNFNRAKAETLKLGYCWKQSAERFSTAFIMPDGFVLGFGSEGVAEIEAPKRLAAARNFRSQVWNTEV